MNNDTVSGPGATPGKKDYNDITDLEHLKGRMTKLGEAVRVLVEEEGLLEAKMELKKFVNLHKDRAEKLSMAKLRRVGLEACIGKIEARKRRGY